MAVGDNTKPVFIEPEDRELAIKLTDAYGTIKNAVGHAIRNEWARVNGRPISGYVPAQHNVAGEVHPDGRITDPQPTPNPE